MVLTLQFDKNLLRYITFSLQRLSRTGLVYHFKIIKLQKKFFIRQWEVDSANNMYHKLKFSTPCIMNKLWRSPACQFKCLKKNLFFYKVLYDDPFKKKNYFWKICSGCEEIQICILHIFRKKMLFEISSSKKSYFWTRTVY